jgi:predicted amidohydrolase YtcJ
MTVMQRRLYFNANIITMNPQRPKAKAMLTCGNRVEKLFVDNPPSHDLPADVARIHLAGRTVLPGFTDSHIHFTGFAQSLARVNLSSARSKREALEILERHSVKAPKGEWLIGFGWSQNNWDNPAFPTAADLDPIFPDTPVALNSKCGHVLWVNSCALKIADAASQSCTECGEIVLDPRSGKPIGIFKESAINLVEQKISKPSPQFVKQLVRDAFPVAHKLGLTSVHVPEETDAFSIFEELRSDGNLKLRVFFFFQAGQLDHLIGLGLHSGFGDQWLRVGGIKVFVDGSLGGRTAWLFEPYVGEPTNLGISCTNRAELLELIRKANANRLSAAVHAIGDRAVALTLDCLSEVNETLPDSLRSSVRNRIEHFQLIRPGDLAEMGKINLFASMQPVHLCEDRRGAEAFWGARSRYAYAFRTIQEAGGTLIFGSDAPVESPSPLLGIYAAVTRKDMSGEPKDGWYPEEKLPLDAILRAYTVDPARASYEEHLKGMLKEGQLADFVVLSDDPFRVEPDATKAITVEATILDGEIVHRTFD